MRTLSTFRFSTAAAAAAARASIAAGTRTWKEVQRILAEVHGVSERQRRWPRRVRIVSVEAVAEKWLVPRLATFKAAHPGIAIEIETNHRGVDPDGRDFDAWFAYTGETAAPRPVTSREDTLLEETLYEEDLLPVCRTGGRNGAPRRYACVWADAAVSCNRPISAPTAMPSISRMCLARSSFMTSCAGLWLSGRSSTYRSSIRTKRFSVTSSPNRATDLGEGRPPQRRPCWPWC